jgi:hypothetical protein
MLKRTTAPAQPPLFTPDVRERVPALSEDVSDEAIEALIFAETEKIELMLGRAFITQTWDWTLDGFPSCYYGDGWDGVPGWAGSPGEVPKWSQYHGAYGTWGFVLPILPVQAIVSITYTDTDGEQQTLDPSAYRLVGYEPAHVFPVRGTSWPTADYGRGAVVIRFRAGYGDTPHDVPEPIRTAIALGVGHTNALIERNLFSSSETVEGIGSINYTVGSGAGNVTRAQVEDLLAPYRTSCGIF